ncbi:hypothetical protein R6242_03875 [Iodobacter sp. CM08]|uniref:VENN motif pre-toxin domain-containing protein n=1 Tax=Iodobacter sp. CM08 TaxID=3085902 RepID=UPI002981ACBB|nr:VENN motif pre-toxin domain-containing protein [Iodobacter sp. CM08]MDW5415707.1 hypothetical protein [Iodobacter sp. CM08]
MIASISDAGKNKLSTGTLTQKDINNHAETSAIGLGGGLDFSSSGKKSESKSADQSNVSASTPSVIGAQDSDSSNTKSAISQGQITLTDDAKQKALTGQTAAETIASLNHDTDGAQQKLANNFNKQQLAEQMAAAKALVQETGRFMANRAADADKAKAALEATDKALTAENAKPAGQKDQARIDDLIQLQARQTEQKADADKWTPGGEYGRAMTVLQVAVGGNVTGGMSGLLQNATVGYLQSISAEKIKDIADSFQTQKGEENQTSQNVRAALHAIASCAGAAATSSNCSSAAVGAASSVVINNALTAADSLSDTQKEQRKNLVGSLIAGIAEATGGNAVAANNAAQIEMENNWLSPSQNAQYLKELKEAKSLLDEIKVSGKWAYISGKQDGLTATGIGKGLAESGWSDVKGIAQFLADPIAGLNGLKQIITSPEVRQQLGETILGELNLKMARMDQALTQGGDVQAEQFGKDLGSLIWQVGSVATGVGGVAKGGVALAKAGVVLSEQGLEALVNTAKFDQLVAKGGVFAVDGKPLMDFRNLTNAQKSVVGDLLGGEKITSLAPGAQKIGRSPGIGQTGIDDLYKVNKPNVDYIVVEYKFGSSVLKETKDGLQMSDSWLSGANTNYNRVLESVENNTIAANKIFDAMNQGRVEKWLVHTDPFGRITVGVLDKNGRFFSDPSLASKLLGGKK